MATNCKADIGAALNMLCSLHDGDQGVLAAIACGQEAVPYLKTLLFRSEPSGLFETRCRAIRALKVLGARDVLAEFLSNPDMATDPVQRVGDEAVIDTAARAVATGTDGDAVFQLLLRLGGAYCYLAGVVEALGSYNRPEAIPVLVLALGEDASRPAAEAALLRLGKVAVPPLAAAARSCWPSASDESDGSRRKRRSALGLLAQIDDAKPMWRSLRSLMDDGDQRISFLACKLCLICGTVAERSGAIERMKGLLRDTDLVLREEINECLKAYAVAIGH